MNINLQSNIRSFGLKILSLALPDKKRAFRSTVISLFIILLSSTSLIAQITNNEYLPSGISDYYSNNSDTSNSIMLNQVEKNYWLPAVEIVGLNLGVWATHRYLTKESWSAISWNSIKENFKNGFDWDADGYLINQFWHPYHGSNYYNSARSNGLSFWESAPYAFTGSLMWEYFMEIEPPSYNDIVNTPVTGIILGEISFRVSDLIIDESSTGFERVLREFSSTLVDPMKGFNRLIRGDMWKSGFKEKNHDFNAVISFGAHNVFFSRKINNSRTYASLRTDLNYGNQFDVKNHNKPFDYFSLRTEINLTADDNIVGIFASGVIWDNNIKIFNTSKNLLGIYKEVDIHINTIYKLSATSISSQIVNTIDLSSNVSMQNYLGLSAILMGGTNSHYAIEAGKDYNIGPGASGKAGFQFFFKEFGDLYANYKRYWIHTLSGAESEEFVGLLNLGISYNLFSKASLGLDFLLYERYGEYKYYPDTQDANSAVRFYIKHSI
ncbi:MAG: DUF3943 domain-containing protein [Ignavibacteriota bacterium]|nr:DUF3943 domain-containing protein [Ignavibacteriota bacterium]MCO6446486.1 DUF3943 domain-containing protein [Ignavibacterium album]MCZ2267925.1 DUF3943 domain-containing protein [Ignavibacteriales bacterium]MEB2297553.1 DUF3943 domain-containing protein [Ignavibacteria bacterium]HOJ06415.1 DUF3943 domain-containing protein [Ignavibacteriaceae bacterium]